MKITDKDIATIEMMHDVLLNKYNYDFNSDLLKRARKLKNKMCETLKNVIK